MAKIFLNVEADSASDLQATLRQLNAASPGSALDFAPNTGANSGSSVGGTVPVAVAVQEATAVPVAEPQTLIPACPELSAGAIEDFLGSDPRYEYRSATAIREHFAAYSADEVNAELDAAVDDGVFNRVHRQRDGEPLYSVAN